MGKFGNILTVFSLSTPTLEILAFFDRIDLGVVNAEVKGPIGGIVVSKAKGRLAPNMLVKRLSPGRGWVVKEVL